MSNFLGGLCKFEITTVLIDACHWNNLHSIAVILFYQTSFEFISIGAGVRPQFHENLRRLGKDGTVCSDLSWILRPNVSSDRHAPKSLIVEFFKIYRFCNFY